MNESEIKLADLFNRYLEIARMDIDRFFQDMSDFVVVRCPACDCPDSAPGFVKLGFEYVVCRNCGTLYVSPRPPVGSLDLYYTTSWHTIGL
jgi:hypothetical protein